MYRTLIGIVAAIVAALALGFFTFARSAERAADFVFVNGTEPKTLDPQMMTGQPEGRLADAIFEGLTYRDPKSLAPTPGLATSWTISEDARTYRFRIRENAVWSDGTPVTAADVAWSWRRMQSPDLGSEYAYILHMVRGAEAYNTYRSAADHLRKKVIPGLASLEAGADGSVSASRWAGFVRDKHVTASVKGSTDAFLLDLLARTDQAVLAEELSRAAAAFEREATARAEAFAHADAHFGIDEGVYVDPSDSAVLVVELVAPTPYFLEITAFYPAYPVPPHVVKDNEDDWFLPEKIVSNGPYRLADWRVNERIRLVKSKMYWGRDEIALDVIDALPTNDTTAAMNLFLTKDVDWAPGPPTSLVPIFQKRPEFRSAPGMIVYYYRLNCTNPVLKNPKVRQAIGLAIDRQAIVDNILQAGQPPALRIVPPGLPRYNPPDSELGYDVERAKRLLAEAGYADGKGIGKLRLLYNTLETHKLIADVVSDQLRRNLGLDVLPLNKEWQTYLADTLALDYEIARAAWIGDYLDPNSFLDMWVTNGGNNQTGWSNSHYDRLIRRAADVEKALETFDGWVGDLKEPDRARELAAAVRSAQDATSRREAAEALRLQLFREAEAILFQDEFPIIPIYYYVTQNLVQPWVEGWHTELELPDGSKVPNLQDIHPLRGIRITGGPRAR
ncbi:MAG: peptide ABC transporter substrate-binding protein [Planctomycetota bacterium]